MTDLNTLIEEAATQAGAGTGLPGLRLKLVEMEEAAQSPEYAALPPEGRTRFQAAYRDLREAVRRAENGGLPAGGAVPGFETSLPAGPAPTANGEAPAERPHSPVAEQQMDEAETNFYEGKYAAAIRIYDLLLAVEPKWERARQHRREAEEYLRTGHIPSVALPPAAASAFGKAQSAARLGRYADALLMLNSAQNALRELGISRWQDGQEFEQKLQQYIDAESVYNEGMQLFSQGQIEDAIERVEAAASATGLPRYADKAGAMQKARSVMQTIAEGLNTAFPDPKDISAIKASLDSLYLQFGENPAFRRFKQRFQELVPVMAGPLKDQVRSLKTQADRAQTIDAATARGRQARDLLDQIKNLGHSDEGVLQLQTDLEKLFRDLQRYEDEIQQAVTVANSNRSWPAAAAAVSQLVRARYPNDPQVIELNRLLAPYNRAKTALRWLLMLLAAGVVAGLLYTGFGYGQNYLLSLTPTATPTLTATRTPTPLPPTATPTLPPTATPTITATPLAAVMAREVWVRSGCYETFPAIGKAPAGAPVRLLPSERKFNTLGSECVLVEYVSPERASVIGYVLIADLKR